MLDITNMNYTGKKHKELNWIDDFIYLNKIIYKAFFNQVAYRAQFIHDYIQICNAEKENFNRHKKIVFITKVGY